MSLHPWIRQQACEWRGTGQASELELTISKQPDTAGCAPERLADSTRKGREKMKELPLLGLESSVLNGF